MLFRDNAVVQRHKRKHFRDNAGDRCHEISFSCPEEDPLLAGRMPGKPACPPLPEQLAESFFHLAHLHYSDAAFRRVEAFQVVVRDKDTCESELLRL